MIELVLRSISFHLSMISVAILFCLVESSKLLLSDYHKSHVLVNTHAKRVAFQAKKNAMEYVRTAKQGTIVVMDLVAASNVI